MKKSRDIFLFRKIENKAKTSRRLDHKEYGPQGDVSQLLNLASGGGCKGGSMTEKLGRLYTTVHINLSTIEKDIQRRHGLYPCSILFVD